VDADLDSEQATAGMDQLRINTPASILSTLDGAERRCRQNGHERAGRAD
jgi:hypothetical protein